MPGIVGIVTNAPRERAEQQLLQMVESLCHERFYVTGMWADETLGVYVGWVARKDSFSDGMPLRNERGDVVLVFSGEEFPEPGIAQHLKARGHELDAAGPSYLVHLYEENSSFPAVLNGRFHGLLIDKNRRAAVLFNDRYSMHRIYYHQSKDAFYFAAEAKAILTVRPELRRMNPRGVGEFVTCGSVLDNRTLFEGVNVLPAASAWVFRNGLLEKKGSYFDPQEWEQQEKLDQETYYRELRKVFARNLPRYFNGEQRIAMSLTGGLDTRIILAWQKPRPGSLPCYTFGSMFRENQDVRIARRVAKICNQPHQVITAGREFLSKFPYYAERAVYFTDGCVDVSRAPDLYLNERTREIAPVRMTGNYGGEVLRRVRGFKPEQPLPGLFNPEVLFNVQRAAEAYGGLLREHPVSFAVFKQGPWHHYGILALEQTQLALRSPYLDNDFVRTVFRAPESTLATNELSLRLIADGNASLLQISTDRGVGERRVTRGFLELQFKAEYAYDMGMPQWLAWINHTLSPLGMERFFLGRHKVFHFRVWYRDVLAAYVQEMLLDPCSLSRPYIERKGLEAVVRGHLKGNRNYTTELHKLLTLEIIHRLFLDTPERGGIKGRPTVPTTARAQISEQRPGDSSVVQGRFPSRA
jgi:asparagine synthase (glutamine-hydrolysing)